MRVGAFLLHARQVGALVIAIFAVACDRAPDPPSPVVSQVMNQVGSGMRDESVPPLLVYVSDEGLTRLDGEDLLDDATILTRARDYQAAHPRGLAVVRCAPAAIHGRARRVVELLEEARIPYVAIDRIK
ncbi:MAG: hypothetical protein ACRELY_15525 [Polyangiaceae bacterium]